MKKPIRKTQTVDKKKRLHQRIYFELYKVHIHLVVGLNLLDAQQAAKEFLGTDNDYNFGAKCMARGDNNFAVLFRRDYLEHSVIAHEVFHLTHFIREYTGDEFCDKGSEAYCYLAEWITAWVYRQLKKAKIRVSI